MVGCSIKSCYKKSVYCEFILFLNSSCIEASRGAQTKELSAKRQEA